MIKTAMNDSSNSETMAKARAMALEHWCRWWWSHMFVSICYVTVGMFTQCGLSSSNDTKESGSVVQEY
jgi:hypothetical protein